MRVLAILLTLPLVVACSSEPPVPVDEIEPVEPIMLGGIDLNQPVRALGTEPFWGVDITPARLTYSGVDRPEQSVANPGPEVMGTTAVYALEDAGGPLTTITLIATECSDGMSDRIYPLTATVKIAGETLNGCAQSVAALESGPRP